MGNNFGRASDVETQTSILRRGLAMIHEVTVPGVLEDWPARRVLYRQEKILMTPLPRALNNS
jgi:hypothetical protein